MNDDIEKWKFAVDNERLIDLVLSGKKKATCSIYDGICDEVSSKSIITYDNDKNACLVETCDNIICKFKDVTWDIAKLEGETDSLDEWKKFLLRDLMVLVKSVFYILMKFSKYIVWLCLQNWNENMLI